LTVDLRMDEFSLGTRAVEKGLRGGGLEFKPQKRKKGARGGRTTSEPRNEESDLLEGLRFGDGIQGGGTLKQI